MLDVEESLPDDYVRYPEPAWRWRRCQQLLERGWRPSQHEEVLLQLAWEFHRDWLRCRHEGRHSVMTRLYPDFASAHRFWHDATPLQRAELEARLLAGEGDEGIAASCGLSASAFYLYHQLFFAVRPYLEVVSYIFEEAIGLRDHHRLRADDQEVLLKLAGYTVGATAVDRLLAYFADPPVCLSSLTSLDTAALETLRQKLLVHTWVLSLTGLANAATAARSPAIQDRLAQACAPPETGADMTNIFAPALNRRQFLAEPAVSAAAPLVSRGAADVREDQGPATSGSRARQAMPA
jgi:hypothetical protein